jgi:CTP:molybdopterin cytidylyltransferase MocA
MSNVVCAVLAAGGSTRLGRPKQLVRYRGVPLVRHVAFEVSKATFAASAIVLGAVSSAVDEALGRLPIERLANRAWREGLASSIRVAAGWAAARKADALVLVLADQPLLDAAHLERLVLAWSRGASVVASEYREVLAVPALFAASRLHALAALEGDRGAARILREEPEVARIPWPEGVVDVDTEADALALRASDRQGLC